MFYYSGVSTGSFSSINLLILLIKYHIRKCKFPNSVPSTFKFKKKKEKAAVACYVSQLKAIQANQDSGTVLCLQREGHCRFALGQISTFYQEL